MTKPEKITVEFDVREIAVLHAAIAAAAEVVIDRSEACDDASPDTIDLVATLASAFYRIADAVNRRVFDHESNMRIGGGFAMVDEFRAIAEQIRRAA